MRYLIGLILVLGFGLRPGTWQGASRADDTETAQLIIERAIRAHGGTNALARARHMVRQLKATTFLANKQIQFTASIVVRLPDRSRTALETDVGGQKRLMLFVVDGDKGWKLTDGAAVDLPRAELETFREQYYVVWLMTLVPLKSTTDFTLKPLSEIMVHGKPAAGVLVTRKGFPDVKLYFDKQNDVLVKMELRSREAGVPVAKEIFFSEWKEFEGVLVPTKEILLFNSEKAGEATVVDVKFPEKLDDAVFARP